MRQKVFDVAIISVPITRKESAETIDHRFARLVAFLGQMSFNQSFFFGSVGIYPKVSTVIMETTFPDAELAPKLLSGERALRAAYPSLNILRLGGLLDRKSTRLNSSH